MAQHFLQTWKGYKPVALLNLLPDDLIRKAALRFSDSHDDLDFLHESAFAGREGTVFGLVSYRGASEPGTQLLAHEDDIAKGVSRIITEAVETLELSPADLRWVLKTEPESNSNRVFISSSFGETFSATLHRELLSHGFEAVIAQATEIQRQTPKSVREVISRCSFVIIAGPATSWTAYEVGIAHALRKPIWRLWHDDFVRLDEGRSIERLFPLDAMHEQHDSWHPRKRMDATRRLWGYIKRKGFGHDPGVSLEPSSDAVRTAVRQVISSLQEASS